MAIRFCRREGGGVMNKYGFRLVVDDRKLDEIFERLMKAKQEIENCYDELRRLDVIKFSSEVAPDSNEPGESITQI